MGRRGQVEVKVGAERGKSDDDFNRIVPKICEK